MIQCPICQVVNDDTALFCAECGQRFGPAASEPPRAQSAPLQAAPQAQPLASLAEQEPKQKRIKLHSPMLGGSDEPEEEGYSKPQLSRLRGTVPGPGGRPSAPPQASEGRSTGGRKHLRSPLLGGGDDDFDDHEEEPVARSKPTPRKTGGGGLRSPLLGESGGDFDDDDDEPPAPRSASGKKPKLRSPLLGDEDDADEDDYTPSQRGRKTRPTGGAEPRASSPSGGLRSPLLGGGDNNEPPSTPMAHKGRTTGGLRSPLLQGGDDYDDDDDDDEPPRPSPNRSPKPGGRQKLHSPMFGDSSNYDDDDDDDDDDEDDDGNPDVLRSPLLAARKKRSAHPPQAPGQPQMQAPPLPGQMPGSLPQSGMPHPAAYNPTQPPGQPGYGAPPMVPPVQPPSELLVASQPPIPGQAPPNYSQQGMPGMPQQPGMPPQPGMQPPPGPNFDLGAPSAISHSGVQRYPSPAHSAPGQASAAPPPAEPREQVNLVSHTSSRSDLSALSSESDDLYAGLAELNKQIDKKEGADVGPSDRRGTDRRKVGRDRRLTSPLVDGGRRFDDDDSDAIASSAKSGGVPMAVPALLIVALLCKGVFFQQVLPTNTLGQLPWYFWLDQAGTGAALLLCLIIVVMSGGKK